MTLEQYWQETKSLAVWKGQTNDQVYLRCPAVNGSNSGLKEAFVVESRRTVGLEERIAC